ncbi:MAG: hypothetical protein R3D62_22170 [Xanthobacteraceae bacterium]
MNMFAIVHDPESAFRAYGEISDLLELYHRRASNIRCKPLVGIWVDGPMPITAFLDAAALKGLGQITESISLGAVWTLCCLESKRVCRVSLVDALRQGASTANPPAGRFVPVFPSDLSHVTIDSELRELRRRLQAEVTAPLYQDRDTGRLVRAEDYAA